MRINNNLLLKYFNPRKLKNSGGLMYKLPQSNLQYVTSITFLLTTYAKYMKSTKHTFNCGNSVIAPNALIKLSRRQVDYILGVNPMKMSYMVGFGSSFPKRIHHRGSSSEPSSSFEHSGMQRRIPVFPHPKP